MICNTIYSCNLYATVLSPAASNPGLYYSCCWCHSLTEHVVNKPIPASPFVHAATHRSLFSISCTSNCLCIPKTKTVLTFASPHKWCFLKQFTQFNFSAIFFKLAWFANICAISSLVLYACPHGCLHLVNVEKCEWCQKERVWFYCVHLGFHF